MLSDAHELVQRLRLVFAAGKGMSAIMHSTVNHSFSCHSDDPFLLLLVRCVVVASRMNIPPEFREKYLKDFETVRAAADEFDSRMEFYHSVFNEEPTTRKYLSLVRTVTRILSS